MFIPFSRLATPKKHIFERSKDTFFHPLATHKGKGILKTRHQRPFFLLAVWQVSYMMIFLGGYSVVKMDRTIQVTLCYHSGGYLGSNPPKGAQDVLQSWQIKVYGSRFPRWLFGIPSINSITRVSYLPSNSGTSRSIGIPYLKMWWSWWWLLWVGG